MFGFYTEGGKYEGCDFGNNKTLFTFVKAREIVDCNRTY